MAPRPSRWPLERRHGAAAALLLAAALARPVARPAADLPPLFEAPWAGYDTGSWDDGFGPRSMDAGDLDGDGDLDLVVALSHFSSPGLAVLRGDGEGSLKRSQLAALARDEVLGQVRLTDFDGDEDLDALATLPGADGRSRVVLLWRNDGAARFSGPERFLGGTGGVGLAVADFDGDGHPDVVTADHGYNGSGSTVSLLLHDGETGAASGFLPPVSFETGPGPKWVEAGDLNGDGRPDLAVARSELAAPRMSLLLNDGTGGFLPPVDLPGGPRGAPVVELGDLDGDGDLEIVTGWQDVGGSVSYGMVRIHWNGGGASFASFTDHRLDPFAEDPVDIELDDLDADGLLDVVTVNTEGRSLEGWRILPSLDGSSFGEPRVHPSSQNTEALLLANVDGDCDTDVLTLARFSSAVTVHLNPGDGLFTRPEPHAVSGYTRELDSADLDGDGDLDLVLASGGVQLFFNDGAGELGAAVDYPAPGAVSSAKLRDLDGDGFADLLMNGPSAGGFSVGLSDGTGGFEAPTTWTLDPCRADRVDAFDLDADGDLDVVLSGCSEGFGGYISVARNDGAAGFSAEARVPTLVTTRGLGAADLNGDGHLDLVAIESGFGLASYAGDGGLGFAPGVLSGGPVHLFALGRLDDDDHVDAAVTVQADSFGSDLVGIARGLGDGTFASPSFVPGSSVLEALRVAVDLDLADADCDGRPDLLVTNYASNDVSVFATRPDATLGPQLRHGVNLTPSSSIAADLTGDGRPDLATVSQEVGPPAVGRSLILLPGTCGAAPAGSGGAGPAEIDPRSLRVRKTGLGGADLEIAFDAGRLRTREHLNVHRGTLAALVRTALHDHGPLDGACRLTGPPALDAAAASAGSPDWYYLAVKACAAKGDLVEGSYGRSFDGRARPERPDSLAASGRSCP